MLCSVIKEKGISLDFITIDDMEGGIGKYHILLLALNFNHISNYVLYVNLYNPLSLCQSFSCSPEASPSQRPSLDINSTSLLLTVRRIILYF